MADHTQSQASRTVAQRLQDIDRRWIFLALAIGVIVPFFMPLGLPVNVTPPTKQLYDHIETLPERTPVMISFDYGPGSKAELEPMAVALVHHCFKRNLRVIGMTLGVEAVPLTEKVLSSVAEKDGKVKNVDWVNLGFRPGVTAVVLGIASGIDTVYSTNADGAAFRDIQALDGVRNYGDLGAVITLSSWASPDVWIRYAHEPFGAKVACGVTGVMVADFYTYLQAGQLVGMLGGLKGAAEYEVLVDKPGEGQKGMDSQSIAHVLIILFVIVGNIAAILGRRDARKGGS